MNKDFAYTNLNIDDVIRITTKEAVGIIGKLTKVDAVNDGLVLEGIKNKEELEQLDNMMDYDTALIPISDIKYIFKLNLKSNKQ